MQHARIIAGASLALLAAHTLHAQAVNSGDTTNTALNSGSGTRVIHRVLAAPRIDPSSPTLRHIAWINRHFEFDAMMIPGDFRESIDVFTDGVRTLAITEGQTPARDAFGLEIPGVLFGGAAYRWTEDLQQGGDLYIAQSDAGFGERNTFGGLTINGADGDGPRIAFFAGVISQAMEDDPQVTDRSMPPTLSSHKPDPMQRGVWSHIPDPFGGFGLVLARRAIEGNAAPLDPMPNAAYSQGRDFAQLHPSSYGPAATHEGSWFTEQRFGPITNITMNRDGAIAFRGQLESTDDPPILGIWADQIINGNQHILHRVFVRHTGPSEDPQAFEWLDFANPGSLDPFVRYRVFDVGPPMLTQGDAPTVAAYLLLNGTADGDDDGANLDLSGDPILQAALVRRKVGVDAQHPDGFQPEIIAIEGERFNVRNTVNDYELALSFKRFERLPGLADFWLARTASFHRMHFKDVFPGLPRTDQIFHPRPSMTENGQVAFLGRIERIHPPSGPAFAPPSDPLAGIASIDPDELIQDEAIWSNRALLPGTLELVVQEGDPAPVVQDGVALTTARFWPIGPDAADLDSEREFQTFSRPLINRLGEIVFVGTWVDDQGTTTDHMDDKLGRSIFVSRRSGHLECLVSSGDVTAKEFNVPGLATAVPGVMSDEFGKVPNPLTTVSPPQSGRAQALGQIAWSDCGILAFTTHLWRHDDPDQPLGWGLFVYNTAEPQDALAVGPQLVAKTSTVGGAEGDLFEIPNLPEFLFIRNSFMYHQGLSVGFGEPTGGDAALHSAGALALGINPDPAVAGGGGFLVTATLAAVTIDRDGDGVLDGCGSCPLTLQCGGGGGECENCLECIEIDCPFGELLLGQGPDFDQNGSVDDTDLGLMVMAMGLKGGRFDMNNDGFVGEKDLALLVAEYGKTVPKE